MKVHAGTNGKVRSADDQQGIQGHSSSKTAEDRQPDDKQAAAMEGKTQSLVIPRSFTRMMFRTWRIRSGTLKRKRKAQKTTLP